MLVVAASWNPILGICKERSWPVLDWGGTGSPSLSTLPTFVLAERRWFISVHPCQAVDLERGGWACAEQKLHVLGLVYRCFWS